MARRRRRKRLPAPLRRDADARRAYLQTIKPIIEPAKRYVRDRVIPWLESVEDRRTDSSIDDDLDQLLDSLGTLHGVESNGDLEDVAKRAARRAERTQRRNHTATVAAAADTSWTSAQKLLRVTLGSVNPLGKEPWLRDAMIEATQEHAELIKGLPKSLYKDLGRSIFNDLEAGKTHREIARRLADDFVRKGVEPSIEKAKRRAQFIAVDQVGKFHGRLDAERQNDLGVTHYIWRTAKDRRVRGRPTKGIGGAYPNARPAHTTREGKRYSWSRRPPGGHPGHDYRCRCYAEPVLGPPDRRTATAESVEQRRETARQQREAARREGQEERARKAREREEAEKARREEQVIDEILGRTAETKRPQKIIREMTRREIRDEVRRLVALNYIPTSNRITPRQQFIRIVDQSDIPDDQQATETTVASAISAFVAGNTTGMINRAPDVFKELTSMELAEGPTEIHRGMAGLSTDTISAMQPGDTFDLGAASSWSKSREVAKEFSLNGPGSVVMTMTTRRGGDISRISQLNQEEEILKSGRARIVSKTWDASENLWRVIVEDIDG